MENMVEKIIEFLISNKCISKEDVPIIKYGCEVIFLSTCELLSVFFIALVLGIFIETVFFFLGFIPLRAFAGGYHATSRMKCYFTLLEIYVAFIIIILNSDFILKFFNIFSFTCSIIVFVVIYRYAPVVHENRRENQSRKRHYRKISMYICIFDLLIVTVGTFIGLSYIIAFILGLITEAMAILLEKIKCIIMKRDLV